MKVKIGRMVCETKNCGNEVVVKKNENGTLSYRCDECDAAPYARVGTGQYKAWSESLNLQADPAPVADPAPNKPAAQKTGHPLFG